MTPVFSFLGIDFAKDFSRARRWLKQPAMKKQPTFRPFEKEASVGKPLHQKQIWETSRISQSGLAPGQAEDKTHCSQPTKPKAPREETQAERMKRARKLAADPNYPTEEIIQALAEMLARHWYS